MNRQFYFYLLRLYLKGMVVLTLLRVIFYFFFMNETGPVSFGEVIHSFGVGMIMDSMVVTCGLTFTFLLACCFKPFTEKYKRIFFLATNVMMGLIFFVNIIDLYFFKQFGCRLNLLATEAMDHYGIILPMIYHEYPVIRIILMFSLLMFLFILIHKRYYKLQVKYDDSKKAKWFSINIISLAALSFLFYGPPLWTLSTFSSSPVLNQMSSNGVYTFIKSIDQNRVYKKDLTVFSDIPDEVALQTIRDVSLHADEKMIPGICPLLRSRINPLGGPMKNVVIIMVESFSASNIGVLNGNPISPNFDRWSKKGFLFSKCYSNGPRTHYGVSSLLGGFPAVLGSHLIRRRGLNEFQTIGNILLNAGYHTQFIHGADASFDEMDLFLKQGGFGHIIDVHDFNSWRFKNTWGVCDEDLFDKALPMIWSQDQKPTLTFMLTISNHAPHEVPPYFSKLHPEVEKMSDKEATFYYTDYCIGKFLDQCALNPEFNNTIFLVIADHGEMYQVKEGQYKIYHIPALILNSSRGSGEFDEVCSQMDFASTLVNECGYTGNYHFVGQDLFSPYYKPFAISRNTESAIVYRYGDHVFFDDLYYKMKFFATVDEHSYASAPIQPSQKEQQEAENFLKDYLEGLSVIFRKGMYQSRK